MKNIQLLCIGLMVVSNLCAQPVLKTMLRLPDTGETISYTSTFGEDHDFVFNAPYFMVNGDGTVIDTVTSLQWQATDGGEMTFENAINYCDTLTLGGYSDWRLPNAHEAFSILNLQYSNPSLDGTMFPLTNAEYWWTSIKQANDSTKVWVTNAGGGIGNHPKSETISAGGTKRFHVRAVRDQLIPTSIPNHFIDQGDGTIYDALTNLVWQKILIADSLTWEDALHYADTCTTSGYTDWRLPNIKELESINDETLINPSINISYFTNIGVNKFWSSTTLPNQTTKAWYLDTHYGITTYDAKTLKHYVLCVRNPSLNTGLRNDDLSMQEYMAQPNPFTSTVFFKPSLDNLNCILTDMTGRVLYKGNHIGEMDWSSMHHGIYLVIIKSEKPRFIKLYKF